MKAGIVYSDAVSTVSPTFASEVLTKEYGCGLEGVFASRESVLRGILNGIDYKIWDPSTDKKLVKNYSPDTIDDKYINKEAMQKEFGLKVDYKIPLIAMISRLADQKGMDLVARVIADIVNKKAQLVILGTGDQKYHVLLEKMAKAHPKNTSINLRFDRALAQKVYAASDMLLIPSRYEPCGLSQMIGFRYGSVPIVRRTGGLKDSVQEFDLKTGEGTGFTFGEYKPETFFIAIKKALAVYQNHDVWRSLVKKDMELDFSWKVSARQYIKLYSTLCHGKKSVKV
jgi:starch synthase